MSARYYHDVIADGFSRKNVWPTKSLYTTRPDESIVCRIPSRPDSSEWVFIRRWGYIFGFALVEIRGTGPCRGGVPMLYCCVRCSPIWVIRAWRAWHLASAWPRPRPRGYRRKVDTATRWSAVRPQYIYKAAILETEQCTRCYSRSRLGGCLKAYAPLRVHLGDSRTPCVKYEHNDVMRWIWTRCHALNMNRGVKYIPT